MTNSLRTLSLKKLALATLDTTAVGSALPVGTVYEAVASTVETAVKTATAEKVVVYLAAAVSTGNAVEGKVYYTKSASEKSNRNQRWKYYTRRTG